MTDHNGIKKHIILISPTSEDFRKPVAEGKVGRFFPPLGLLLVAQSLKNAGYEVHLFDGNNDQNYKESILGAVTERPSEINYVGFYLAFLQVKDCIELLKSIKSKWPRITTFLGGPFPSVFPEKTVESKLVDVVCYGDGAEISVRVADCIKNGKDWSEIPNLYFKKDGCTHNNPKTITDSLGAHNYIHYEDFLDLEKYVGKFDVYLGRDFDSEIKRAIPILTALGCSYKCTFCENALLDHKHRSLGAKEIVEQMNFYYENFAIETFSFFDEEFAADKKRIYELVALLEKNPYKFKWGTQIRASDLNKNFINKDLLRRLENSGCIRFSMGIESGSPKILKKIKKGLTPELAIHAAECGRDSSIVFSYSFIVNLPGETDEDLEMTFSLSKKLLAIKRNSFVSAIHPYFAYPGTPLANEIAEKSGYRLEEHFDFEGFADTDLHQYNALVNPINDPIRNCRIAHFIHKQQPFEVKLRKAAILKNFFKLIGLTRNLLGFYRFPLEIILRDRFLSRRGGAHSGQHLFDKRKKLVKN